MKPEVELRIATAAATLADARRLMQDYAASLPFLIDVCHFDDEMNAFPGRYAPPAGALVVAYAGGAAAGVVGLRPIAEPSVCEMKRLYVPPAFRGLGIGEKLVAALIAEARARKYRRMRLDSHAPSMAKAIALYRGFGFVEIERPADVAIDPPPDAAADLVFMELAL
ncbi:MAG: GNAT family N-acetyltransferase [Vulcanimicrobiaceae bacterium]